MALISIDENGDVRNWRDSQEIADSLYRDNETRLVIQIPDGPGMNRVRILFARGGVNVELSSLNGEVEMSAQD